MSHARGHTDLAELSLVGRLRERGKRVFSFRNDLGGLWLNESRLLPIIGRSRFALSPSPFLRVHPLAHPNPRQRKFV